MDCTTTPEVMLDKPQNPRKKRSKLLPTKKPKITRPCTECGKTFRSWKALFGHMRCHPERQWRGINPPQKSILTDEDHQIAHSLLLLSSNGSPATPSCYANTEDHTNRVHKCSICLRVFSSGQALGGHKRCHWEKTESDLTQSFDLNYPLTEHEPSASYPCSISDFQLDLRLGL